MDTDLIEAMFPLEFKKVSPAVIQLTFTVESHGQFVESDSFLVSRSDDGLFTVEIKSNSYDMKQRIMSRDLADECQRALNAGTELFEAIQGLESGFRSYVSECSGEDEEGKNDETSTELDGEDLLDAEGQDSDVKSGLNLKTLCEADMRITEEQFLQWAAERRSAGLAPQVDAGKSNAVKAPTGRQWFELQTNLALYEDDET